MKSSLGTCAVVLGVAAIISWFVVLLAVYALIGAVLR